MADSYTRVFRAENSVEAHMIKGMLEQHGVRARVVGGGLSSGVGELPADVIQVDVEVPTGYRQYARELIDGYEQNRATDDASDESWSCPACAESNPASFETCWQCGTARGREGVING